MGHEVVTYNVCDRCPGEVIAEETHKLALNGCKYEIDLCPACAMELFSAVMDWADAGRQVGEPTLFDRPRKLTATTAVTQLPKIVKLPETRQQQRKVDELFADWRLTSHAQMRQAERHFTDEEVVLAVAAPEHVEHHDDEGKWFHTRGKVTAVTDITTKTVITLLFSSTDDWAAFKADIGTESREAAAAHS